MTNKKQKQILVLGGGFAGVRATLAIAKKMPRDRVILISNSKFHEYHPSLYEVATTKRSDGPVLSLRQAAAVPLDQVVKQRKNAYFKQAWVEEIDLDHQIVSTDYGELVYDGLVIALGSKTDYYNIPGLENNSYGLKSFAQAIALRNRIKECVDEFNETGREELLHFIVGGGGFTGVEFAGELMNYLKHLCAKKAKASHKAKVYVIEGGPQLLGGLPRKAADLAFDRLQKMGVEIHLNCRIVEVDQGGAKLDSGQQVAARTVIWTGGVRSCQAPFSKNVAVDNKDRIIVSPRLNLDQHPEVFTIGDNSCWLDPQTKKPLPQTALVAMHQADFVADAIKAVLTSEVAPAYQPKKYWPMIVPLSGKYAIFVYKNTILTGFLPYAMKRFADLHYFTTVMPWWQAFHYWLKGSYIYIKND